MDRDGETEEERGEGSVDGKRGAWEVELAPGKMVVGQQEKIKGKTVRMKM